MDDGRVAREARGALSEFADVVRRRRMTRAFDGRPVEGEIIERMVDLATRAPSAGKSQGWHVIVLSGPAETARYWDITLPPEQRAGFAFPRLLDAPVLMLPLADAGMYVSRYAEPDKARTGLGAGADAWPVPYWTIDASMAMMTLLLAAEDEGLGALLFGLFDREAEVRAELAIPDEQQILGVIAIGWPLRDAETAAAPGRSANRPRRSPQEIIHRDGW